MQLITGNTYPVKDKIKALGGRWNAAAAGWDVPDTVAEDCRRIVAEQREPARTSRPSRSSRYRSNYTRFAGGGEHYVNKRGRCEDAPCCGCCS
jgi:hypothetical protein